MNSEKKAPNIIALIFVGSMLCAAGFQYFLPLKMTTENETNYTLEYEHIHSIQPDHQEQTFYVTFKDGRTIRSKEGFDYFETKSGFNINDYSEKIKTSKNIAINALDFGTSDHCDPHVGDYNVFEIHSFIQIDPTYFIVLHEGNIATCSCDDEDVLKGRVPACPWEHHRLKMEILNRMRQCDLGDWIPIEECSPY